MPELDVVSREPYCAQASLTTSAAALGSPLQDLTELLIQADPENAVPVLIGSATTQAYKLIGLNSSDQVDVGVSGTQTNLLGTVVAPAIDPPTVNGQVTAGAVAAAWAHFTVSGGAVTLRDSYNVTSVTYNAAGDYTVAWDRDFSTAYYAAVVTVVDNGGVLLAPKVNSQAAGSADVWVYNVAAVKTDPDAISVIAFGTLS